MPTIHTHGVPGQELGKEGPRQPPAGPLWSSYARNRGSNDQRFEKRAQLPLDNLKVAAAFLKTATPRVARQVSTHVISAARPPIIQATVSAFSCMSLDDTGGQGPLRSPAHRGPQLHEDARQALARGHGAGTGGESILVLNLSGCAALAEP